MNFSRTFGVYSWRRQDSQNAPASLTDEFRYRVVRLCSEWFIDPLDQLHQLFPGSSRRQDFWYGIHRKLQFLHGRSILMETSREAAPDEKDDTTAFLSQCSDEHFLDFIELIFQLDEFWRARSDSSDLIDSINRLFQLDDLPYLFTELVYDSRFSPHRRIVTYPRVIRRDSEVLDETAMQPALKLLADPVFASANQEYLGALKDYRNGDCSDCVTKCGSSLESVMKVICDQKGWPYQQNDQAETLLNNIFPQTRLGSFFKQPIMLVATIRNRLGSAHGAGTEPREVPAHVAHFTINATASAILLLVEEINQ